MRKRPIADIRPATRGLSHSGSEVQALRAVLDFEAPADRVLRDFFRTHRQIGRNDRARVSETVFDVLRHRRLYAHLAQDGGGDQEDLIERLVAVSQVRRRIAQRPGTEADERAMAPWLRRARDFDPASLPFDVRYSLPPWLARALTSVRGAERAPRAAPDEVSRLPPDETAVLAPDEPSALPSDDAPTADAHALAAALLEPAPLDLRVNVLRGDRADAIAMLAADGIQAEPLTLVPQALRVTGKPALEAGRAFVEGRIEVQDAGSQLLAMLVAPRRGQTIVDLCAGAGGKTLALAAAMRCTGQIIACDVSASRLQRLRDRLQRASATNVQPMVIADTHDRKLAPLAGRADAVLVDAPCSGTGTLRRNPDLKWRMDEAAIERLVAEQRSILSAAAQLVRPGGALVYATCSLLEAENEAQALAFESASLQFVRDDALRVLQGQGARLEPQDGMSDGFLRLRPDRHQVDGFFAARWVRRPTSGRA